MPTLDFYGKEIVHSYHYGISHRPLETDIAKSLNPAETGDNLIIHGDNLHALKALLPRYAGRVKCIYIDPPYNTGNEGWVYNDKLNSPELKRWFRQEVGSDDLERHDKWCCMMWPRLQLLKELLADDGAIFVSIDDNEQHHLRMLMDEIFGEQNFVASFVWNKKNVVQNDARFASVNHEYVIGYRKSGSFTKFNTLPRTETANRRYTNPDNDPKGPWQSVALQAKSGTQESVYQVTFPNGVSWTPPSGTYPKFTKENLLKLYDDGQLFFGKSGRNVPRLKKYLSEVMSGMVSNSLLTTDEVGSTQSATELLNRTMGESVFESPKAVGLITRLLKLTTDKDSIVLDSFAGSGTTGHAVLALNKEDGGNRQFILVEGQDYADRITAERVRRVIRGVPEARDKSLREGLGGSFTYCTLGQPIEIEGMLSGDNLPEYGVLASYLLYKAATISPEAASLRPLNDDGLFYETGATDYYLLYRPDLEWLRSNEGVLNRERAERISRAVRAANRERNALVYAPCKYINQRELARLGLEFCQLPREIHHPR